MKKIAVILNGCGHRDGSEVHEAVLTLLGIEEAGGHWECLALDRDQAAVTDHVTGRDMDGTHRNMLHESARIARGRIKDLATARVSDYGAVIIPGGSGTARNLCNFASAGAGMTVDATVERFVHDAHAAGLPIGAVCISPVILARIFGAKGVELTLGSVDNDAARAAKKWGAKVIACEASGCVVDDRLKVATAPAYMCDAGVAEIAQGIRKLTRKMVEWA
jgi:enhancing lycopene biosynthesis protein 2